MSGVAGFLFLLIKRKEVFSYLSRKIELVKVVGAPVLPVSSIELNNFSMVAFLVLLRKAIARWFSAQVKENCGIIRNEKKKGV